MAAIYGLIGYHESTKDLALNFNWREIYAPKVFGENMNFMVLDVSNFVQSGI